MFIKPYAAGMRPGATAALYLTASLVLAACGGGETGTTAAGGDEPLDVVVGFYPYEYVAQQVGGDDVTVSNLTAPGAEPHDLELSPQQVAEVAEADLVLYSPGFQPAVDEAVEQHSADRSFDVLGAVELREYEEAAHSEEEAHAEEGHAHDGEDPHIWLDPTRLATVADAVAEQLAERSPERAEGFRTRAAELRTELEALDAELQAGLSSCARDDLVTSHDAFGYLADRYGLEQVAIGGLSPEDEPSVRRLAEVAQIAKERQVTTVFFEELVSPRVAESLAREIGAQATVLSPLEVPSESGDYVEAMRANLQTLRTALDCA